MTAKIQSYKDLDVWKVGKEIVLDTYKLTKAFPEEEKWGLSSQMRRCAVSIPSNVAEGFMRWHRKEYQRFLGITLGSCAELETQLEISKELGFGEKTKYNNLLEKVNHEIRMVRNLIKSVEKSSNLKMT